VLKVVVKTFQVVEAIAEYPNGVQLGELAKKCGKQPKATIFRILHTLKALGYVRQDEESGAYLLAQEASCFSRGEVRESLKRAAKPYLERLLGSFEQTVALGVLDRDQLLYVQILEGLRSIRMNATVNTYAPLHCTSMGKAILSRLSPDELRDIADRKLLTKFTPKTITSIGKLERHLAEVRSRGYATDDEETEEGARCVGAAIIGNKGRAMAAISVSGPTSFITAARVPEIAREVKRACRAISELMGAQEPPETAARGSKRAG
jgi:DNA-binding IclR family transcriptional regulator